MPLIGIIVRISTKKGEELGKLGTRILREDQEDSRVECQPRVPRALTETLCLIPFLLCGFTGEACNTVSLVWLYVLMRCGLLCKLCLCSSCVYDFEV